MHSIALKNPLEIVRRTDYPAGDKVRIVFREMSSGEELAFTAAPDQVRELQIGRQVRMHFELI